MERKLRIRENELLYLEGREPKIFGEGHNYTVHVANFNLETLERFFLPEYKLVEYFSYIYKWGTFGNIFKGIIFFHPSPTHII